MDPEDAEQDEHPPGPGDPIAHALARMCDHFEFAKADAKRIKRILRECFPPPPKPRRMSRAAQWADAAARAVSALDDLKSIQDEYQSWRDNMPESLQSSPVGEKLDTICDLDIEGAQSTVQDAEAADLPRGYGAD